MDSTQPDMPAVSHHLNFPKPSLPASYTPNTTHQMCPGFHIHSTSPTLCLPITPQTQLTRCAWALTSLASPHPSSTARLASCICCCCCCCCCWWCCNTCCWCCCKLCWLCRGSCCVRTAPPRLTGWISCTPCWLVTRVTGWPRPMPLRPPASPLPCPCPGGATKVRTKVAVGGALERAGSWACDAVAIRDAIFWDAAPAPALSATTPMRQKDFALLKARTHKNKRSCHIIQSIFTLCKHDLVGNFHRK